MQHNFSPTFRRVSVYLIYAAVAVYTLVMCGTVEWSWDDFGYMFSHYDGARIDSVDDILHSQFTHYLGVNGRFCAHVLCNLFLALLGKGVFCVVNMLFTVWLLSLSKRLAGVARYSVRGTVITAILLFFALDLFYEPTCQIGYVWTTAILIWYLLTLRRLGSGHHPWYIYLCVIVLGIVAGDGHEGLNIGVGAALGLYTIIQWRRLSSVQIAALAAFAVGVCILCLAPGNMRRAGASGNWLSAITFGIRSLRVFYVYLAVLALLAIRRINWCDYLRRNLYPLVALAFIIAFQLKVGAVNNRQYYGMELIAALLILRALNDYDLWPGLIFTILLGVATLAVAWHKYMLVSRFNVEYLNIRSQVENRAAGDEPVVYIDLTPPHKYLHPVHDINYIRHDNFMRLLQADVFHTDSFALETTSLVDDTTVILKYRFYPTAMRQIATMPATNRAVEVAPGYYMLMRDKRNPARFEMQRCLDIAGLHIPMAPQPVEIIPGELDTDDYNIAIVNSTAPLIEYTGCTISNR